MCGLSPVDRATCGGKLKRTVCISCRCLQTPKLPSGGRNTRATPLLTMEAGSPSGGASCWQCFNACSGSGLICATHWSHRQFLLSGGGLGCCSGAANEKALTLANQGFSFGAGEMNRTPDLLITNEGMKQFALVD